MRHGVITFRDSMVKFAPTSFARSNVRVSAG
jgi:hypothetical protein